MQEAMRDLAREEDEEEREARCFTASQEECSEQGLVYVAGYLCHKLAHKYQWMGARTCDVDESEADNSKSINRRYTVHVNKFI